MDVRQFAFLARQPSAAMKPRDAFFGLPKRGLALILANALFWQPLLAQAEGIVVSAPGTTVGAAGNGVPVVNIATPNGSGLSHNQFKDYNVGPNGVILNNASGAVTNTQLGGYIVGNPNLKGGAASVILNEVNGGNPSQLRGYTEVAGQSAKVIVANPYGISCNGCGFINTPNATLTTGKPVIDPTGQLKSYQVDGGAVTIDGQGLNASNVDRFEIITRSAKINAQINARQLTVIAGRNDVDAQTLNATARADDGSAKPELAIDSSALGGMYAGAIKLVGTEAGVGVKLDGTLAASGGDIQLDANGHLSMAQAAATGNVTVNAQNIDLTDRVYATGNVQVTSAQALVNQKSVAAGQRIEINATTVTNPGIIEAGVAPDNSRNATGDLVVNAQTVNTTGNLLASRTLAITAAQTLTNQDGVIQGKTVSIDAAKLVNQGEVARVYGVKSLAINAPAIVNLGGLLRFGEGQAATLDSASLDNRQGRIEMAGGSLVLSSAALNNSEGKIIASDLTVNAGRVNNQSGLLVANTVTVTADTLDNSNGTLASQLGNLKLTVKALTNRGGKLFGKELLTFDGATLDNSANGQISGNRLDLTARDTLTNRGGLIEASQGLTLGGGNLDNSAGGQVRSLAGTSSSLDFSGQVSNQKGILEFGSQAFSLDAGHLNNQAGQLQHAGSGLFRVKTASLSGSQGDINGLGTADWSFGTVDGLGRVQLNERLTYTSPQNLTLKAGDRMASAKGLVLDVASLDNGGELLSDGDLSITLSGDMTNSGRVSALQKLSVQANSLSQNGGRLAGNTTQLNLRGTLDNLGYLTARQQLDIAALQINNRGTLGAQGAVNLSAVNGITNGADSLLFSGADLTLRGNGFSNVYGDVYTQGNLTFAARDGGQAAVFSNLSGTVEAEGSIGINAAFVENAKAVFELGRTVTTGSVYWQCGQHCDGDYSYKRGEIRINQTFLESALKDSAPARLVAGKDMLIQGDNVQNRYSLLAANGNLGIVANNLLNQGAGTRTGQNSIVIGTPRRIDKHYWDHVEYVEVPAFSAAVAAGHFDLATFEALKARSSDWRFAEASNVTTWTVKDALVYNATLQAGGTVDLSKVVNTVQNGTLLENQKAQLTGTLDNDQTGIPVGGINISLSQQASAPGSAFTPVDPTTSPYFKLPKGEYGLFVKNADPTSHYLIETNPQFASLSGFFSSDYMLDKLGFSADTAWRRLGDGQYETRLIRDAVLAQTGQRFLTSALSSDADQFRYLMDNALASKDALRLSLGVSLTSQQVGALTHDIVWMENRVIDGQSVLVPVLYLAQAESRNVRGSSLIQGRDLNLVTGGDLLNVGTLRASNNLSAAAGGSLYNGGLIEAGNNLTLLAQDSIRNAMAGEIRGTQVNLAALKGDITNDTTAIQVRDGAGMRTLTDNGTSTISARDNLVMEAGRDLINRGALAGGNDVTLTAGRDLSLLPVSDTRVKHEFSDGGHKSSITTDVKNLAASVTAGGNLNMKAGQDVNIIGSTATAGKDINVDVGRDFNVVSVSDVHSVEGKEKHGKKRIKTMDEQTTQVASVLTAGGDFRSQAGRDTTLVASKISAGNEAYLYSGEQMNLLAAENSTHTLYDMKEKGSWGAKKAQMDEVTRTTQVGTEIKAGGNLTLKSGGDQLYQVAKLNSGKDIILDSSGAIVFEGVKDLHDESHTKSKSDLSWFSAKGKGNTDETLRQSELVAQGQLVIKAAEGIRIDVKQVDQQTVSQTVDAMVKADPNLAWLKQAEARGDIDWRQVKEIHESFKYDNSGLGAGAKIAIAIMMAAIMGPAGFGLGGWQLAVATSFSTTGVTSTINNKGNLGRALKETVSTDSLKSAAVAGFTAGALEYADTNWFAGADKAGASTSTVQGVNPSAGSTLAVTNSSKDIFTWTSAGDIALRTGGRAVISSGISTAIQGGSFGDNFNAALLGEAGNVAMATGFNWVGDYVTFPNGSPQKIIAHALMGGLLAEATGSDFKTGAAAAGLNEALINQLTWAAQGNKDITLMLSQLTGLLAAAAVDGDLEKGSQIAQKATTFNYLYHKEVEEMLREVDSKSTEQEKRAVRERYAALDQQRNDELDALCARDPQRCRGIAISLANDDQKLVDLVGKLRSQGQGGAASAVGFVIGSNLDASSKIAADISSAGGGVLVKLGAEAIKAGVGVTLPSRSGAGKGKGSQGEAAGPDVPQGAKANVGSISHISGVNLPKSQSKMIADFEAAGYPTKPVVSPTSGNVVGTQYILPDGSRVRVMQADGRSPQRASFENANGGPVDPTTGKPPQPPQGLSKAERKQWIRERTHIEQVD
ncbi:DUF637 domain-containing protein [Pseudomonas veronii]|jgi:filamentous hemagglutinin|uniref:two-partner secretion domain-containing protein n=1 Tax=Pseudomonas veronii TaxID=76761 RepID=UPI0021CCEBAC|nr:DUF637 domain-containing protein [Pseudomonas veronii]